MTVLLSIALSLLAQAQEMVTIKVTGGREMSGLYDREDVIRGTCDGRPASLTITKVYRGQTPRLVLRANEWTREVPRAFLNGALFSSGLKSAELACDGERLQVTGLAIRTNAQGEIIMDLQNVIMDLHTGAISLTELRTLSAEETRSEFR